MVMVFLWQLRKLLRNFKIIYCHDNIDRNQNFLSLIIIGHDGVIPDNISEPEQKVKNTHCYFRYNASRK